MYFQIIDRNRVCDHEVVTEGNTAKEAKNAATEYFVERAEEPGYYEFELIVRCVIDEDDMYSETDEDWDLCFYKQDEKSDHEEHFNQRNYL